MLGLAAWLVLRQELSAGAMIAASILMGRALQPVEQAVAQWPVVTTARQATVRLAGLLSAAPPEPTRTRLPRPQAMLDVQGLTVVPPGAAAPVLRDLAFRLSPGQALGVIGPSASGKSSLARALIGVWRPSAGRIRLEGAALDQYDLDVLGSLIGYLPQRVGLFDGTIAENIARLQADADPGRIIAAAQAAAAHEMILQLPEGYDTQVASVGSRLSGGQIQRIGLARALYGDPVLLILDEPNSNLDNDGAVALNQAIRSAKQRGAAVLIMAHRPAALQDCDLLLVLQDGASAAFGPRDAVLRALVRNAGDIARATAPAGVA
jgi:ATP-binding cassette subfamily C protein